MFKHYVCCFVLALTPASIRAQEQAAAVPDFAGMDKAVLVVMCEQLYKRVQSLEAEVERLKQGGAAAVEPADDESLATNEGTWTVKIAANPRPDTKALERQIAAEKSNMQNMSSRISAANKRVTDMEGARETYRDNGEWKTRDKYSARDISNARMESRKLETERRGFQVKVNQLEAQVRQANSERHITGLTDDGKPIVIIARGVSFAAGSQLQEGKWYLVTGRAHFTDASGKVYLKSAVPAPPEMATTAAED